MEPFKEQQSGMWFFFSTAAWNYTCPIIFFFGEIYIFLLVQMLNLADILFPEYPLEPFSEIPVLYLWSVSATRLRLFEVRIWEWQLAASF